MLFELPDPTQATIVSVTPRGEKHGDEDTPAVSFGVKIVAPNTILDRLSPDLLPMFYKAAPEPERQPEFEETKVVHLPLLRTGVLETVHVKAKLEGWTVHLEYGIDDDSAVVFGLCKIDEFRFTPLEGGSVELRFRVGTSDINVNSSGRLGMSVKAQVSLKITAPKPGTGTLKHQGDLIDGSRDGDGPFADGVGDGEEEEGDDGDGPADPFGETDGPGADTTTPEGALAAATGDPTSPFPTSATDPAGQPPQDVTTEPQGDPFPTRGKRTKRGHDATRAFIAQHAPKADGEQHADA